MRNWAFGAAASRVLGLAASLALTAAACAGAAPIAPRALLLEGPLESRSARDFLGGDLAGERFDGGLAPGARSGTDAAKITPVAQGCGPGGWRGPWGGCRYGYAPFYGPRPFYAPLPLYGGAYVYGYNGCPPGFWRGPWGHCRNTPYHGRWPDGFYH